MRVVFFFQAEDGIRDAQESRGLGDVYKRQGQIVARVFLNPEYLEKHLHLDKMGSLASEPAIQRLLEEIKAQANQNLSAFSRICLLYTSDAADDLLCVDLGGRRILKKKKQQHTITCLLYTTHAPTNDRATTYLLTPYAHTDTNT